jgi:spore coat protein U-like protein
MTLRPRFLALAAALALAVPAANATQVQDQFLVSITLTNTCSIVANDLDFGPRTGLTANIDVNTTVDVTCTGANPVSVAFNAGSATGSTIPNRLLINGATTVAYNIYSDAAHANVLGSTAGTNTVDFTSTGSGTVDTFTVYGRVPAQAAKPNGTYTSTVTATLTY